MPDTASPVPDFTKWPSFPFEGDLRVKQLDDPVENEPARKGEDSGDCSACNAPDEAYIWVSERWRVRAMDRPTGLPMVLILESRSHLDLGDLPNLLAAELGVMTVRLERAVRSLDGVARVHVNRWGDGSAHLHMWFLARPYGRLQLRGTFLSLWDDILPPISEARWRENLAMVAAWLAEFGGKPLAEPPRIEWQAPSSLLQQAEAEAANLARAAAADDASVALAEAPADADLDPDLDADVDADRHADVGADVDENRVDGVHTDRDHTSRGSTDNGRTNEGHADRDRTDDSHPDVDSADAGAPDASRTASGRTAADSTGGKGTAGNIAGGKTAGGPAPSGAIENQTEERADPDATTVDLARQGAPASGQSSPDAKAAPEAEPEPDANPGPEGNPVPEARSAPEAESATDTQPTRTGKPEPQRAAS